MLDSIINSFINNSLIQREIDNAFDVTLVSEMITMLKRIIKSEEI